MTQSEPPKGHTDTMKVIESTKPPISQPGQYKGRVVDNELDEKRKKVTLIVKEKDTAETFSKVLSASLEPNQPLRILIDGWGLPLEGETFDIRGLNDKPVCFSLDIRPRANGTSGMSVGFVLADKS